LLCLGLVDRCGCRCNLRFGVGDRCLCDTDLAVGLIQCDLIVAGVDLDDDRAGVDMLVIGDGNIRDITRYLGSDEKLRASTKASSVVS